ncbi:putative ribonuclease H-like domain-containing protein [Tanacetum coccineum]
MPSLSTQLQGSQLVHEDLEQLYDDDLEEMDLRWNMALNVSTVIKWDIFLENAEHQEVKITEIGIKEAHQRQGIEFKQTWLSWHSQHSEESDNSKENTDDSLKQQQKTDSSLVKSPLKVDKDWKENFFYPANHVREEEPKKARENTDAPIIEDWVSDDEEEVEPIPKVEKKTAIPTATKKESVKPEKPIRRSVSCPNAHKHMVPRAVLMKTGLKTVNNARPVNTVRHQNINIVSARGFNAVKPSACWVWRPIKPNGASLLNDKGFVDSGCSRHMSGNIAHLSDFKDFDGGYVTFGGGANGGRITGKVSHKCVTKRYYVLFTDSGCLVLSLNFKLPDENQILLKIPRQNNMYSFDMKNIVPKDGLTCLVAKATSEESMLWHRRLGHVNFKNINKLVKENLVRDLPLKRFENDQTCVACLKGKQHRASCKTKAFSPITKPLFMLHMDLFGPTFVSSLMHKKYCLVVTDDYSKFSWVFFLKTKDETSKILKNFIKEIENLVDKKVKIIRSDNRTEFKNNVMDEFYREKGIKREYSVARTPQQNGVAKRKNRTLIEAARTMVLIVKPHNKTPYELFRGIKPVIGFMKPFGCHVTILNTLDKLGKFDGKSDFFVGYSLSSKAFRVYNIRTRKVQKNLHVGFLENKPMIEGNGPKWLFDLDSLTQSMNYVPVVAGTFSNDSAEESHDGSNIQNNGIADQQVNTARQEVNTGSREVSTAIPEMTLFLDLPKKELCDEFEKLMKDKFQMSSNGRIIFFLGLQKALWSSGDADDVDEHLYRSMIGSLMYLTTSRPDIMFAVCACARFQDSPLELVSLNCYYYVELHFDRKSTTGGCQFLGNRLISWQCKKQTVVATSTTEAEYVAAASCCGQVLWIQNQLLDYGYNFMNTVIYIDNTSTICIIENPVQHSKTKHIEIRHHFIRDCNAKKLIQMAKIDTQLNVADLLTKGFDAGRFQYLVSSIGMLNP